MNSPAQGMSGRACAAARGGGLSAETYDKPAEFLEKDPRGRQLGVLDESKEAVRQAHGLFMMGCRVSSTRRV